jgi:hypothetical protein
MARDLFHDAVKNALIAEYHPEIFVYDIENEVIVKWKI